MQFLHVLWCICKRGGALEQGREMWCNLVGEVLVAGTKLDVEQHVIQDVEYMQPPPLRGWARHLLRAAGE